MVNPEVHGYLVDEHHSLMRTWEILSLQPCLADLIKDHYSDDGGLLESDVKAFAKSILLDLEYIHKKGYAHLDINPDNIVLVPRGDHYSSKKMKIKRSANSGASADDFVAKIADFATAKSFNQILKSDIVV
ncbi:hypothetical protein Syun_008731 [Stephania yunnanensis]|uniref:Protein kinase domain-containing protein n=1 Tax=Stephania yunnanensis TaxID=152371 RepID=A0AAP0KFQ5_9MAGN